MSVNFSVSDKNANDNAKRIKNSFLNSPEQLLYDEKAMEPVCMFIKDGFFQNGIRFKID